MKSFHFVSPDGKTELKLRLRSSDQVELVKELGTGIITAFGELHENPAGFLVPLIWKSAQAFQSGYTKRQAFELFDELVDADWTLVEMMGLATEVLSASGFMSPEEAAEAKEFTR